MNLRMLGSSSSVSDRMNRIRDNVVALIQNCGVPNTSLLKIELSRLGAITVSKVMEQLINDTTSRKVGVGYTYDRLYSLISSCLWALESEVPELSPPCLPWGPALGAVVVIVMAVFWSSLSCTVEGVSKMPKL